MNRHIPQLDGLRAMAILMVLVTHFWGYPDGYTMLNRFAAAGWLGVDLFFVLSGFLITSILWDARDQPRYFVNFYARRALRIFPIYYLLLALVFICLPLVARLPGRLDFDEWMYWLYLGNFAVAASGWQLFLVDITWSLSVEEQFYLVWPAVIRRLTYRRMVGLCLALIVLAPLIRFALWQPDRWMWLHMMTPLRADAFAFGAVVAVLVKHGVALPARRTLAVAAPVLISLIATGNFHRESMLVGTIGYSLAGVVAAASLVVAMQTRLLAVRPLLHIGKVSYGMYLYHPLCLIVVVRMLDAAAVSLSDLSGSCVRLVLVTVATVLAASASYSLIEVRLLRLKRHFENRAADPSRAGAISTAHE